MDQGEKGLYHVASYQLSDAKLGIKHLNEKLVDDELKKTADLPRAFLKHKDNKNLVVNLVKFPGSNSSPTFLRLAKRLAKLSVLLNQLTELPKKIA